MNKSNINPSLTNRKIVKHKYRASFHTTGKACASSGDLRQLVGNFRAR